MCVVTKATAERLSLEELGAWRAFLRTHSFLQRKLEAERGAIVVMSTHDPEAAAQTDAEIELDEGTMRWARSVG